CGAEVVLGDTIFEPEFVEQAALIPPLPPQHSPHPARPMIDQPPESRFARLLKPFFNSIGQSRRPAVLSCCSDRSMDRWDKGRRVPITVAPVTMDLARPAEVPTANQQGSPSNNQESQQNNHRSNGRPIWRLQVPAFE